MQLPGKTGKKPALCDVRDLPFDRYLGGEPLPPVPAVRDNGLGVPFNREPLGNDKRGCCTTKACADLIQVLCDRKGLRSGITEEGVLKAYADISGWDGTEETDNGAYLLDAMKYLRNVGICGWKCKAFFSVSFFDPRLLSAAVELAGGVIIGQRLPQTIVVGETWDVVDGMRPGAAGGHATAFWGSSPGMLNGKTWTYPLWETPEFLYRCADEAYVPYFPELVPESGRHLDLVALEHDLSLL